VSALLVKLCVIGDYREESALTICVKLEKSVRVVEICAMHNEEYGTKAARKFWLFQSSIKVSKGKR
jgi:hypothetical protein